MATQRLYFDDPYLRQFNARVVERGRFNEHPAVVLDQSAFYPEGGGQPGDRGVLNGIAVVDTQSDEHDAVWHLLATPLNDEEVQAELDWARRFDFMQQHHGQHLLSAIAEQLLDARTVAVHLGEETCTVDLQISALTVEQVVELELRTNATVWANLPVAARFVTPDELAQLSLRKPAQAYERIRIVSAGDLDHSPCGGTHPQRTGEVGCVVLRRWERYKGGIRVEFVCGERAIGDYRRKTELLAELTGELRVGLPELPAAVERLRGAEERARKRLEHAEDRLLGYESMELIAAATRINDMPVVVQAYAERTLEQLRLLAKHIADRGGVALLGLKAEKAQLVFTRGTGLSPDMGALLRSASAIVGGRGGGKADAAQGGGPDVAKLEAALEHAVDELQRTLGGS